MISGINGKPNQKTKILSLFSKFDSLLIEKIIGTDNSKKFLAEYNKSTHFILWL